MGSYICIKNLFIILYYTWQTALKVFSSYGKTAVQIPRAGASLHRSYQLKIAYCITVSFKTFFSAVLPALVLYRIFTCTPYILFRQQHIPFSKVFIVQCYTACSRIHNNISPAEVMSILYMLFNQPILCCQTSLHPREYLLRSWTEFVIQIQENAFFFLRFWSPGCMSQIDIADPIDSTDVLSTHSKALSCWFTVTSFSQIIYRAVDLHTLSSCSLLSPAVCLAVRVGLQNVKYFVWACWGAQKPFSSRAQGFESQLGTPKLNSASWWQELPHSWPGPQQSGDFSVQGFSWGFP